MISQFTPPTVDGFSRFVFHWLRLLSDWRFDEAVVLIDEPAPDGNIWGIEDIQQALRDYDGDSGLPQINDPASILEPCEPALSRFDNWTGYRLEYPMPIHGTWSDLKVRFAFIRRPGGYAVALCGFVNARPGEAEGTAV